MFITIGFKQWKNALDKSSGFKRHESSSEHKKCQVMLVEYTSMKRKNISVSTLINETHLILIKENRKYIQYIGNVLLFTAVQGIAQREDDESENSVNCGNFLELVHLLEYFNDDFKAKKSNHFQLIQSILALACRMKCLQFLVK